MKRCVVTLFLVVVCLSLASMASAQNSPPYKWTGFYAGLNGGYSFGGNNDWGFEPLDSTSMFGFVSGRISEPSYKPKGFLGGVQVGYDYQISDRLLVGVETDFQYSDIKDKSSGFVPGDSAFFPTTTNIKQEISWLGTTRLRFGVFPVQRFLIYGTGGLAYGRLKASSILNVDQGFQVVTMGGSSKKTQAGYTMGGGLEFALAKNITAKAEYLYYNLGKHHVDMYSIGGALLGNGDGSFTTRGNIVRMGVNYRF